jgi:excinuclease UvrABC nuclease subunit
MFLRKRQYYKTMQENSNLKEKMTSAPRSPGVYLMRDAQGKIIYVGKANDLKSRIGSYFTGKDTRPILHRAILNSVPTSN